MMGGDGCHRSAGFALYATGIVLWMTLVSCTGSTYIIPLAPDHVDASVYVIAQQITYVTFYFVVAFATWKRPLKASSHAFIFVVAGAFAVSAGCLVLIYLGFASPLVQGVYGFSMGLAIASGYMQWLRLVVARPLEEIEQLLVIASVASIASGAVVAFLPLGVRVILFVLVLAPASVLMLSRNTQIVVSEGSFGGTRSPSARVLGRELMVPALCAVVLVLVAPIVSATYYSGGEQPLVRVLFAQGANIIGLGILAFFLFGLKRNVTIFSVYCALLPLLASSVLAASFFEPQQRWFVLLLGGCVLLYGFLSSAPDKLRDGETTRFAHHRGIWIVGRMRLSRPNSGNAHRGAMGTIAFRARAVRDCGPSSLRLDGSPVFFFLFYGTGSAMRPVRLLWLRQLICLRRATFWRSAIACPIDRRKFWNSRPMVMGRPMWPRRCVCQKTR